MMAARPTRAVVISTASEARSTGPMRWCVMGDARENILWVHPRVRVVASRVGVAWCVTCSVLVLCVSLRARRGVGG